VPVPQAFDAVSGLGPALEVHAEAPGIQLLPNWGTPVARAVVRYQHGLACQTYKDHAILTLRWDDVAAIVTNNQYHHNYTQCEYTLVRSSGEKLILDDSLKAVQRLAAYIEQPVYERLGPPLAAAYAAGQPQTFGPVTVGRASGLALAGTPYAWDAIQDVKVENGRFKLTLRDGHKHEARTNTIPNIELLCQLIGVKLISSDLAYY
jgi:hypothetical protein